LGNGYDGYGECADGGSRFFRLNFRLSKVVDGNSDIALTGSFSYAQGFVMKILLVTEESVLAELIAFRLELMGHLVETRQSSASLMMALEQDNYALAMVDTELPDSNIRETLTKVRSRWSKNHLPILVISLDQSLELVEQVFRCGADDYLLAPFDPQTLQAKLDRLLDARHEMKSTKPRLQKVH
jgi:DNA-binding response OmpR family regulator